MKCVLDRATVDYEEHGEGWPILFLDDWTMNRRLENRAANPPHSYGEVAR